ncbi:MAG: hypothetical protein CMH54_13160 [Myxococcales bacterium]|nr:hypothetical protein [Myxococcales bacterium]
MTTPDSTDPGPDTNQERRPFTRLGLRPELLKAIESMGFELSMPVQTQVLLKGKDRDLIVQARTGSGKTLAYGCTILQHVHTGIREHQVLVICPTRELAAQVAEEMELLARELDLRTAVITGGASFHTQLSALKNGASIISGTPGRLLHHLKERNLKAHQIKYVVLDEADRLLDMGFRDDLELILHQLKNRERTIMCSATMPASVDYLANKHTNDPVELTIDGGHDAHSDITHKLYVVPGTRRFDGFLNVARFENCERGIIFCSTRRETMALFERMKETGFKVGILSGEMPQKRRDRMLDRFRRNHLSFMVATDVAARGLDVEGLTHVFHYRIPQDAESYVHRSGRTGRADQTGISAAIISPTEVGEFQKLIKSLPATFAVYRVPELGDFEADGQTDTHDVIPNLQKTLTTEYEHAERRTLGSMEVLKSWFKNSEAVGGLVGQEATQQQPAETKKASPWSGPVIDLRKGRR